MQVVISRANEMVGDVLGPGADMGFAMKFHMRQFYVAALYCCRVNVG